MSDSTATKRRASGGPVQAPSKRAVHNASEQRRAKRINSQIDALRDTLSDAGLDFKRDKGSVLEAAVMYIHDLEERQRRSTASADTASDTSHPASARAPEEEGHATCMAEQRVDYKGVFQYSAMPMAVASMDGSFLDCNLAFCDITGYSRAEVLQRSFFNFTPPQELQMTFSIVSELMGQGGSGTRPAHITKTFTKSCNMKHGTRRMHVKMAVVKDSEEAPAFFTCAVMPAETVTGGLAVRSLSEDSGSCAFRRSGGAPGSSSPADTDSSSGGGGAGSAQSSASRSGTPAPPVVAPAPALSGVMSAYAAGAASQPRQADQGEGPAAVATPHRAGLPSTRTHLPRSNPAVADVGAPTTAPAGLTDVGAGAGPPYPHSTHGGRSPAHPLDQLIAHGYVAEGGGGHGGGLPPPALHPGGGGGVIPPSVGSAEPLHALASKPYVPGVGAQSSFTQGTFDGLFSGMGGDSLFGGEEGDSWAGPGK